jgi:hypothetical protein
MMIATSPSLDVGRKRFPMLLSATPMDPGQKSLGQLLRRIFQISTGVVMDKIGLVFYIPFQDLRVGLTFFVISQVQLNEVILVILVVLHVTLTGLVSVSLIP